MFVRVPDVQIAHLFLSLAVLLAATLMLGEFTRRVLKLPALVGVVASGILLGPSVLGKLAPDLSAIVFPEITGSFLGVAVAGSLTMFMFVSGYELGLTAIKKSFARSVSIFAFALMIPMVLGGAIGYACHPILNGITGGTPWGTAVILGTILSITAVPIVTAVLKDVNLSRDPIAAPITVAAAMSDLVGALLAGLAITLRASPSAHAQAGHNPGVLATLGGVAALVVAIPVGTVIVNKAFIMMDKHKCAPNSQIVFPLICGMVGFWGAEMIGMHGLFGAFAAGIAVGDADEAYFGHHLRRLHEDFINSIFKPIFLGTIGLRADLLGAMNGTIIVIVFTLAMSTKILGGYIGARLARYDHRTSIGVGLAMTANGALMIVLAMLASSQGAISEELMTAIVISAVLSNVIASQCKYFLAPRVLSVPATTATVTTA